MTTWTQFTRCPHSVRLQSQRTRGSLSPSGAEGAASREAGLVFNVTQTAVNRTKASYSQAHLFFILIKPHSGGINANKLFVLICAGLERLHEVAQIIRLSSFLQVHS